MRQDSIAELKDSTDLLTDAAAVKARFDEDGYIFVRRQIDPDLIQWALSKYIEKLADERLVASHASVPVWTGNAKQTPEPCDRLGTKVWSEIVALPSVNDLSLKVLGEPPVWVPIVRHRCTLPCGPEKDEEDIFELRHQDGFFNEGLDFAICWLPMMEISRARGGLAIAPNLHKRGYFHEDRAPFRIPNGSIPVEAWATADFKPGDMLIFNKSTPHVGLKNRTNQIRLSMDLRVIPTSARKPIVGVVSNLEGCHVTIRTEGGETLIIEVTDETFIRDMTPNKRYPTSELDKIAHVGAKVMAIANDNHRASLMRPIVY